MKNDQKSEEETKRPFEDTVSITNPDWSREHIDKFWHPSAKLINAIRSYQRWSNKKNILSPFMKRIAIFRHTFWSTISGADIPIKTKIGGGLLLPHPNGIVIHPDSIIGINCLILQQVTLGTKSDNNRAPVIGSHVDIGAGAKILGEVKIGNHVQIGANAVVLQDIPDNCDAVGIPARVINRKK